MTNHQLCASNTCQWNTITISIIDNNFGLLDRPIKRMPKSERDFERSLK